MALEFPPVALDLLNYSRFGFLLQGASYVSASQHRDGGRGELRGRVKPERDSTRKERYPYPR